MPLHCFRCLASCVTLGLLGLAIAQPFAAGAEEVPRRELLKTFVSEFVPITPGEGIFPKSFQQGSDTATAAGPVREVTLAHPFAIAKYEVPQNLYEAVTGENPSRWKGPRNSVELVSWGEAVEFCDKLTRQLRSEGLIAEDEVIRLPTESEWEYCCRAGTTTAYSFGDSARTDADTGAKASQLDPYAWHTGNAAGNDPPVGALRPNPWGLYDMHGYLWEFCADVWRPDYTEAPVDGSARTSGMKENSRDLKRVIRGGSWKDRYSDLQCASRKAIDWNGKDDAVGFRCVKSRPIPTK